MSTSITLTSAVRANLLALQNTTANQATTQQRLATGKKVNSALDNPTNFFTAASLSSRAGELTNLLDSMTNGVNVIKAADNGLTSITTSIQSMQATITQARQDASWQSGSYSVDATNNQITVGGTAGVLTGAGFPTPTSSAAAGNAESVDAIVTAINANTSLAGKVKASNNAGQLQVTNLSISSLTVTGVGASGKVDGSGGTTTVAGNTVRGNLVTQFNQLKDQLDKTAQDASFNGINLLSGDALKLFFNENSTSSLTIQSTNTSGINSATLSIGSSTNTEFQSNSSLDTRLQTLHTALTTVASQSSAFGSNPSIVQNRQDFTNNMVNNLQVGSDGLTLADTNLEAANMIALQTRQQPSITPLSLASQANQAVLHLFG